MARQEGFHVVVKGRDIYFELWMPAVPRKGDVLWLSSLSRGTVPTLEGVVDRVEWSMTQASGTITAWLHVRRTLEPT